MTARDKRVAHRVCAIPILPFQLSPILLSNSPIKSGQHFLFLCNRLCRTYIYYLYIHNKNIRYKVSIINHHFVCYKCYSIYNKQSDDEKHLILTKKLEIFFKSNFMVFQIGYFKNVNIKWNIENFS